MPRPRIPGRRRHLLDAARNLALEKGWSATTVADIAARAGIGKGAVYLEFADKPAILDAVLRHSMRGLTADVHRRALAHPGPLDLPAVYRLAIEALLADPLMRAFHLGDQSVLGEHVRSVSDDRYRQRFDWLLDYIARLQTARMVDPAIPRETLARMLSTFTIGLLHTPGTLGPMGDDQLRESVELFARLVGHGLTTDGQADPEAARAAQLDLLRALEDQLDHLEDQ